MDFFINAFLSSISLYDSVYLGVGIAFNNQDLEINMSIVCVGETLKKECIISKVRHHVLVKLFKVFGTYITNYLQNWLRYKKMDDLWLFTVKKTNQYIRLNLSKHEENRPFNVFNYHMLCSFTNPDLMNIQAASVIKSVNKESKDILAGDFNSIPDSTVYNLITGSRLPFFEFSTTYSEVPTFKLPHGLAGRK